MGCTISTPVLLNVRTNVTKLNTSKVSTESQTKTTRFIENCILIWLADQSLLKQQNAINQLRYEMSMLKTFTDFDACFHYINGIHDEKIFLIISCECGNLIEDIHHLPQIEEVYIFNPNPLCHRADRISNQIPQSHNFQNMTSLCEQLHKDRELFEWDCINISTVFPLPPDDTSLKRTAAFLFTQFLKEIVPNYRFENDSKTRFVDFCREYYANDQEQMKLIEDFERTYRPQKALYWLTEPCFASRIINRVQRTMEIDLLYKMGFLTKHIHVQIVNLHSNAELNSGKESFILYRSKTMLESEFDMLLRNSSGGFLSSSCFLITTTDKMRAINFLHGRLATHPQRIPILFEIHIDTTKHMITPVALLEKTDQEIGTANNEFCFTFSTVFYIESIQQTNAFSINMRIIKLTLVDDSHPHLFHLLEPLRSTEAQSNPLAFVGKLSIDMGDFDHAEKYYLQVLLDKSVIDQPRRSARLQNGLGLIFTLKNDFSRALEHYEKALEANLRCLQPDHSDFIPIYIAIGDCHVKLRNHLLGLKNYERAAEIVQRNDKYNEQKIIDDLKNRISSTRTLLKDKL